VDTSFLPDRDREETERREREELRQEWLQQQEKIKNELIEITYSYWDGTGHRRSAMVSVYMRLVVHRLRRGNSVRRGTTSPLSFRNAKSNHLNYVGSASIT
jgi:XAP5, circadian clock regulator